MKEDEKTLSKRFVDSWRHAGPELEAIRRQELASFDFAANQHLVDDLLAAGLRERKPRTSSGLVELQQWFMKLAEREGLLPAAVREKRAEYPDPDGSA